MVNRQQFYTVDDESLYIDFLYYNMLQIKLFDESRH